MSPRQQPMDDSDDFFAHTRMSLGDHIEELRGAMWKAIKWFGIMMIIGFCVAQYALAFIAKPVAQEMKRLRNERVDKLSAEYEEQKKVGHGPLVDDFPPSKVEATMS